MHTFGNKHKANQKKASPKNLRFSLLKSPKGTSKSTSTSAEMTTVVEAIYNAPSMQLVITTTIKIEFS